MNIKNILNNKGSALVTMLVFVTIGIIVISAAVAITIINTQSTTVLSIGDQTHHLAETGLENAILGILRDPNNYTGETLNIGDSTITTNISGTTTKTIIVTSTNGDYIRKVEIVGDITNNQFDITSWSEID